MPRLNHGTLLENLVVLEVTRSLASTADTTVEFASAFAMSPLTQCWHKTRHDLDKYPRFNANVMNDLLDGVLTVGAPTSYSALLLDCLKNAADLPVVPYALDDAELVYPIGGPNGALLAALLRRRQGKAIRIWSNDLVDTGARYHSAVACNAATECLRTNEYAEALSSSGGAVGIDGFCDEEFPASVAAMAAWRQPCMVRIGFLDPDSYVLNGAPSPGQIFSTSHVNWLTSLHQHSSCTAGIMFFASQDDLTRPALIASFHNDAVGEYPHSVVFRHGNFMVGVKLRYDGADPIPLIIGGLRNSWADWSAVVGRRPEKLRWHIDGKE
jgi:hypothetical protein